jgi:thioredoxin-like negative regulator of GroEL
MYRFGARLRGIKPGSVTEIDLQELGAHANEQVIVQFTHPLCTDCRSVEKRLAAEGHNLLIVDVSKRPDLARKYQVSVVPTALSVGGNGKVLARLA